MPVLQTGAERQLEPPGLHPLPPSAALNSDRLGNDNGVYRFDEDDAITLPTPFAAGDADISILLWMAPSVVNDGAWHGFCGYQVLDHRVTPSKTVEGDARQG
jgi:hypothetical protein